MRAGRAAICLGTLALFAACAKPPNDRFQGYVEGEFVYVSSPLAGTLQKLAVARGHQVEPNELLFQLDETMEKAARDQAQAALVLSETEFGRQEKLFQSGPAAEEDFDRARSTRDQDRQRLTEAEWNFAQMKRSAPQAGLVYDTLFRPGEWVEAGKPVVSLLPPANIKVRAFVPETIVGALRIGETSRVTLDGVAQPFTGKITYISPHAEYTPPVIYSRESRSKLVYMIEIHFAPNDAAKLHPGQPVDVQFVRQ